MTTDPFLVPASAMVTLCLARRGDHRQAVLAGTMLSWLAWWWLYTDDRVPVWSALAVLAGSLLGALTATALTTGIAEDNAPPSPAVRDAVLAQHRGLRCLPEPAGKRIFDVVVATLGIVVTLPAWLLIALMIWWEEPGPVFFVKNSVGRGGVTFREFKFRSMRYNAEASTGPVVSCPDDPRTLRVGRWLRRWHLDEIPELINVLSGSMSLVGPRPLRTVLVDEYLREVPEFVERHTVKPGIACTAQIERYRMEPHERLRKDRQYIHAMSVRADVTLLWCAVLTTLLGVRDRTEVSDCGIDG